MPGASACALLGLPAKASALIDGFQPEQLQTQAMLLRQRLQFVFGSFARRKQAKQIRCDARLNRLVIHPRHLAAIRFINQLQTAKFFDAPQALVVQRALRFDHLRLKQQSADFSRCFYGFNPPCLRQHARFIRIAQMRLHTRSDVNAFTNVKRQVALAMKDINPGCAGQIGNLQHTRHKLSIVNFLNLTTPLLYCNAIGPAPVCVLSFVSTVV